MNASEVPLVFNHNLNSMTPYLAQTTSQISLANWSDGPSDVDALRNESMPTVQAQVVNQPEEQGQANMQLHIRVFVQARVDQLEAANGNQPIDKESTLIHSLLLALRALCSDETTIERARALASASNAAAKEEKGKCYKM